LEACFQLTLVYLQQYVTHLVQIAADASAELSMVRLFCG
jgi:hypothetical protein